MSDSESDTTFEEVMIALHRARSTIQSARIDDVGQDLRLAGVRYELARLERHINSAMSEVDAIRRNILDTIYAEVDPWEPRIDPDGHKEQVP